MRLRSRVNPRVTRVVILVVTVVQLCQPPVFWIKILATGVAVGLSMATCTRPLTPGGAPDATRTVKVFIPPLWKLTLLKPIQSPLEIQPMLRPPPSSEVGSVFTPLLESKFSARMRVPASIAFPMMMSGIDGVRFGAT